MPVPNYYFKYDTFPYCCGVGMYYLFPEMPYDTAAVDFEQRLEEQQGRLFEEEDVEHGIVTVWVNGRQHRQWGDVLRAKGFKEIEECRVKNPNTGNTLHFWVKKMKQPND